MSSGVSSKVCKFLDLLFGKIVVSLSRMDVGNTLNVFRIEEECVWLDMLGRHKLYGMKIEGDDNTIKKFSRQMDTIIPAIRFSDKSDVGIFFVNKNGRQAVYLYAFDKRIIGQLSRDFRIPHMNGDTLVTSILDLMLAQQFTERANRLVPVGFSSAPFIPYGLEMASGKFRERAMVAVDNILREYTIFQGEEYESIGDFDPVELFNVEWEGVFSLWINFSANAVDGRVKQYESTAKFADKDFSAECAALMQKDDEEFSRLIRDDSFIVNSMLILKDPSSLPALTSVLKIHFGKNYLTGPSVVAKTLMLSRDAGFDAILPKDTVLKYFVSSHKRPTPPNFRCDFSGKDISGNFIDYSLANNENPHSILTGKTGSGKSVQAILILEKILGFNHSTGKAERFYDQRIRYADVGFTSGNIVEKLKHSHPRDVEIFGSDVSKLRFGLFDFEISESGKMQEEDKLFLISFLSFVLEIEEMKPLVGMERSTFEEAVDEMLKESNTNNMFVEDLIKIGGYELVVNNIINDGFSTKTKLKDLSDDYNFLKKPVLSQLLNVISIKANNTDSSEADRQTCLDLYSKMRTVNSNPMISLLANTPIKDDKHFFHIDFQSIKDDPRAFSICYWMIMKTWLKQMERNAIPRFAQGLPPETVFFFIEEAHNFFKYKSFELMLTTAAKEIRKFGGRLFFITQDIYDLPQKVYQELSTKIFVASMSELERYKKVSEVVYPMGDMAPINKVIDSLSDRMLLILSDRGAIGCRMIMEADLSFYKPKKIS
jgi:hypothetical protein